MTLRSSALMSPAASGFDGKPAIGLVHLSRQTLGDRQLETELLGLFATQARTIVTALGAPAPDVRGRSAADLLHTLCGSARAIGAWAVSAQAERLERDLRQTSGQPDGAGLAALGQGVAAACAAIDDLLDGDPL